jgi:hypothetical protein
VKERLKKLGEEKEAERLRQEREEQEKVRLEEEEKNKKYTKVKANPQPVYRVKSTATNKEDT